MMRLLLTALIITSLAAAATAADLKIAPLPVRAERVFADHQFDRPILVTHAGDGSGRVFVVGQKGPIHVLPQAGGERQVYLDITDRVVYKDKENEEGLLGMAFHPDYKDNGEFFLYYTTTDAPHTSVISRFRVSKDDPNKADPNSEEEILRIKQPYWNHNGGTIIFGPDGYLYIGLGDGGSANDPHGNGQNLGTLLGSILRIDVDRKSNSKNYAIPPDNPFVNRKGARPEIYAYGLRNIWRMAFDPATKKLWAGDVGQNLWEEIDIIQKGGNYGWNVREGLHPFPPDQPPRPHQGMIDPIFEYNHSLGKSITGGEVYRGKAIPALIGKYVYADYVAGLTWGLTYDEKSKQVTGNQPIQAPQLPVMSFGSDEDGELYMTTAVGLIYKLVPAEK